MQKFLWLLEGALIGSVILVVLYFLNLLFEKTVAKKKIKQNIDSSKSTSDFELLPTTSSKYPIEYKKTRKYYSEFIVIDTETTGLDYMNDHLLEIGAVHVKDGEIIDTFSTLINLCIDIPEKITEINGIDDLMVEDAPFIEDVIPKFIDFIGNYTLVAHNANFDMKFLIYNIEIIDLKINNPVADTLSLSRKVLPNLKNHKLGTLAKHFNIKIENQHRALDDALATAQVYIKCHEILKEQKTKSKVKSS